MKYAQLIIGLLVGTALGGSVVAGTGMMPDQAPAPAALDQDAVKAIVRQVINDEPQLLVDSLKKFQMDEQKKQMNSLNEVLKDPKIRDQVFNDPSAASIGPKDAKKIVVEFFDYDCPACKMMFNSIDQIVTKDKDVRIIFREYPIFGAVSDQNSRLGLAVAKLYPEKYYAFHQKMMSGPGHSASETKTLGIIKDLGLDVEKIKAEAAKKEMNDILEANRALGDKLHIQGTPTLVIGDEIVPHALSPEDLEEKLAASVAPKAEEQKPAAEDKPADAAKAGDAPSAKKDEPRAATNPEMKSEGKPEAKPAAEPHQD